MADHMTAEQLREDLADKAQLYRSQALAMESLADDEIAEILDGFADCLEDIAARLSGMAADTGDRCEYVVRQHLKHAAGGIFVDVWKAPAERLALDVYATYIGDFPHQYFEVLRITHREDCIVHNGIPDYAPAAPEPPHV